MGWRFSSNVIRESWASIKDPWLWRDSGGPPRRLSAANIRIKISFKILSDTMLSLTPGSPKAGRSWSD